MVAAVELDGAFVVLIGKLKYSIKDRACKVALNDRKISWFVANLDDKELEIRVFSSLHETDSVRTLLVKTKTSLYGLAGQSKIVIVLTGDARPRFFESYALLEEQVRRARSDDGRL